MSNEQEALSRKRKRSLKDPNLPDHQQKRNKSSDRKDIEARDGDSNVKKSKKRLEKKSEDIPPVASTDGHTTSRSALRRHRKAQRPLLPNGRPHEQENKTSDTNTLSKSINAESSSHVDAQLIPNTPSKAQQRQDLSKKKNGHEKFNRESYNLSQAVGGRFLSLDLLFSQDEKYLFLATKRSVNIYSTETSHLVRSMLVGEKHLISDIALSCTNNDHIYISTETGRISLWDWTTGSEIQSSVLALEIYQLYTSPSNDSTHDIIYLHACSESGDHSIIAYQFPSRQKQDSASHITLLKHSSRIQSFRLVSKGRIIAVACEEMMILGEQQQTSSSWKDLSYTWWELKNSQKITSFDCHVSGLEKKRPQKKINNSPGGDSLNLAIGDVTGAIVVYEDILKKLAQVESSNTISSQDFTPRVFDWHRKAVTTVKWSLDGNYVISGGKETVLLLWQLETGKRQELPHLTAPILNVTVSPTGTSYAVHLEDNSFMVLSTSELKPKANISGIQSPAPAFLHTIPMGSEGPKDGARVLRNVPIALNPLQPNLLFIAVPSSQATPGDTKDSVAAPYLETFDLSYGHHISRQALTRNHATDLNMGPTGTDLKEPNVKFLKISCDGKWLATVEEWNPPAKDLEHAYGDRVNDHARYTRSEIFLKFWRLDTEKGVWTLESRIDSPHQFVDDNISAKVFDLIEDPQNLGFVTIGQDGFVRAWRPKTQLTNGKIVQGYKEDGVAVWTNRYTVPLENVLSSSVFGNSSDITASPVNAKLAFSADGSVLAAASWPVSGQFQRPLILIDGQSGTIKHILSGLVTGELASLAFIGQYLVLLGEDVTVWDLVTNEPKYCHTFQGPRLGKAPRLLAINNFDGTFAISISSFLSPSKDRKQAVESARVLIFRPTVPTPIFQLNYPHSITGLLPVFDDRGFITLDTLAEIRILSPRTGSLGQLIGLTAHSKHVKIQGEDQNEETTSLAANDSEVDSQDKAVITANKPVTSTLDIVQDLDNDKPVVQPQQLAAIFESGPSFALPSVKDLFQAVIGLYARKEKSTY